MGQTKSKTTIKLNGEKYAQENLSLIDCVRNRDIMLLFVYWSKMHFCAENILFWLDSQMVKYAEEDKTKEIVLQVGNKYFGDVEVLNIENVAMVQEAKRKYKTGSKTAFNRVQNEIFRLMGDDSFPKFRSAYWKNIKKGVTKEIIQNIIKWDSEIIEKLDTFLNHVAALEDYTPVEISEVEDENPQLSDMWRDTELMLGFREYLYRKKKNSLFSAYIHIEYFQNIDQDPDLAQAIHENYISVLDLENQISEEQLEDPTTSLFTQVLPEIIHDVETLFDKFLSSDLYHATRDGTIVYKKTKKLLKGNTVKFYSALQE
eukprot:TRINITY_DN160_c0_g1_i1.p1 TRINITY_DN160_c0_g1~~TRINITY_DN160_c0_g1_i1.p1  ORF type:complete len:316 (+),score=81.67 TRINITY_DN160_c0_g1_i1:46-993(+)